MLQIGGYPNSSNITNVKTAYTFVNGEKKYFWKDKVVYDNYWNDNYYSRIIYAFLLNNSTNNTLRVVYLDDSDAIKTKDFTLPNVTGYTNRVSNDYNFQVKGNSLLIYLKYTDPSRTANIDKLFYISDVLTSSSVIDIYFDDGNFYTISYYRLAKYGIWLSLDISSASNTYFVPFPTQNVTLADSYKNNLWSPVGKTINWSRQTIIPNGRILFCAFTQSDRATYILRDTTTGESLVKIIKNLPDVYDYGSTKRYAIPCTISGNFAYSRIGSSQVKVLNLLTNESHIANCTTSGSTYDYIFEFIPKGSLWNVNSMSPSIAGLIKINENDETFEQTDLGLYSYDSGSIYDKESQVLWTIIRQSTDYSLYKSLTDITIFTCPTNFSIVIQTANNHCLVACDSTSSRTSFPFQISKDYGTTWTSVGNALGYDS